MDSHADSHWPPSLFRPLAWQMSWGERAAMEGVLAQLRPRLAIEIGTAEGGSLARVAHHSDEVHALDLVPVAGDVPGNVELHIGDSKQVLPELLERIASEGRNVDFALVDGDHSAEGVRSDLRALLESDAVRRTLILLHDTMNEVTRSGIKSAGVEGFDKVRHVELDFLAGYMGREEPFRGQLWGGLGLIVVDADGDPGVEGSLDGDPRYFDAHTMVRRLGGGFASDRDGSAPMITAYGEGSGGAEAERRGPLGRLAARLRR